MLTLIFLKVSAVKCLSTLHSRLMGSAAEEAGRKRQVDQSMSRLVAVVVFVAVIVLDWISIFSWLLTMFVIV